MINYIFLTIYCQYKEGKGTALTEQCKSMLPGCSIVVRKVFLSSSQSVRKMLPEKTNAGNISRLESLPAFTLFAAEISRAYSS